MSNYAQDARDADKAFRADGQLISLSLKQPGAYSGGAVTPGAPIIETAWGIETGVTLRDLGVGTVSGTMIQAGDRKLDMSALNAVTGAALIQPKVGDLATVGNIVYTIKNVDKVSPGGVVIMYMLVARL